MLEIFADKKPWNEAQKISIGAIVETTGLHRDTFDIMCLTDGIRISLSGSSVGKTVSQTQLATITIGSKSVVIEALLRTLKPDINMELYLEEV